MATQESCTSSLQIERRSIDCIPPEERHGTPLRLFFSGLYYVLHLGVDVMPRTTSQPPAPSAEPVETTGR